MIHDVPFMLVCENDIVNNYETLELTYESTFMRDKYYTLPEWCKLYEAHKIDNYDLKIKQNVIIEFSFTGNKSYNATLNFRLLSVRNCVYEFEMILSIDRCLVTNSRDWKFSYNSINKDIVWFLPDDEFDIMIPPPFSNRVEEYSSKHKFYYKDGSVFKLPANTMFIVPDYLIVISINEINDFLMTDIK